MTVGAAESDLHYLELTELAGHIRARQISPVTVTRWQLERIASVDGALGSYALMMPDVAMAEAASAEAEIAAGHYRGPLHGVPIAVKDLFWTKDFSTTSGMAIYKNFHPQDDATVGMPIIGRAFHQAVQAWRQQQVYALARSPQIPAVRSAGRRRPTASRG
jgi:Asp-tRNA(Asn)/Glu-tRNA(Gln) amidotransferase A subunit family amidase